MAITVKGPLLEGDGASGDGKSLDCSEAYIVYDVNDLTENTRKFTAMFHNDVPDYGEAHPYSPTLIVAKKSVEAMSPTQYKVICTYGLFNSKVVPDDTQACSVRAGITVQSFTTNQDINGDPLTVTYTPTGGDPISRNGTADIDIPMLTLEFSRLEADFPIGKALIYSETTNADSFLGDPPGTWLLQAICGETSGDNWQVTYTMQRSPYGLGFDAKITYIDKETGEPPLDPPVSISNGLAYYVMYESTNFSDLNISV